MEVRMSDAPPEESDWCCTMKLRYEYDAKNVKLGRVREEQFGPVLQGKSELETWVRRAQKALLNPSKKPTQFLDSQVDRGTAGAEAPLLPAAAGDKNELKFTRNVIVLEIQGELWASFA